MKKTFLQEYQKLDQAYDERLDQLVDAFISELDLPSEQQKSIRDILTKMKNYCYITYRHSLYVAFRTHDLAYTYLNKDDPYYSLTEQEYKNLCVAAILHDAGKLDIDLALLEKPIRLTDVEFQIMKTHAIKTKDHLQGFSDDIINIAIHHHEKLNGTGYPEGLKGDEINLSTRILTVADITSALMQKRAYKEAYTIDQIADDLTHNVINGKIDDVIANDMIDILFKEDRLSDTEKN